MVSRSCTCPYSNGIMCRGRGGTHCLCIRRVRYEGPWPMGSTHAPWASLLGPPRARLATGAPPEDIDASRSVDRKCIDVSVAIVRWLKFSCMLFPTSLLVLVGKERAYWGRAPDPTQSLSWWTSLWGVPSEGGKKSPARGASVALCETTL